MVPSMTACGSSRKMTWSLQVPGSDSSPLTRTYLGFSDCLGNEGPLHAGGEACAATSAEARGLHDVDDPAGHLLRALGEGLLDGLVAVELDVLFDVGCALAEAAARAL